MKLTGSSFEGFVRDEYTTLADSRDRPLFIHLDVHWRNRDFASARRRRGGPRLGSGDVRRVRLGLDPGARARDGRCARSTAFPELDEISFAGENRLWDTAQVDGRDERVRVYTDPRPPYGRIELTLGR